MKSKKPPIIAVAVTISLFGVAAFANPVTNFFDSFVVSVKSVFISEKEKTETNSIIKNENQSQSILPSVITKNDSDETVPEQVLWRIVFGFPAKFEKNAEEAKQKGESDSLWTNFFTGQAKLSETDAELFKEIAEQHEQEIQILDEKMQNLMEEVRQMRKQILQKEISQRSGLIESQQQKKKELVETQKQKDEITLRYRDNFKNAVGEQSFSAFEKWLKEEFAKGFAAKKITSEDKSNAPLKASPNNGFKPTKQPQKEERQK